MGKINILIIAALLSGCGVDGSGVDRAITLCEGHDGIKYLWPTLFYSDVSVVCNDGAKIKQAGQ